MLKLDKRKSYKKNEEKLTFNVEHNKLVDGLPNKKTIRLKHHQNVALSDDEKNSIDSSENRINLLVKAAEKVDRVEMSSTANSIKSNNLSSFLSNNSSMLDSKQHQDQKSISDSLSGSQLQPQSSAPIFIGKNGKPTRPFKAYPKEPLSMSITGTKTTASSTLSNLINSINPSSLISVNSSSDLINKANSSASNNSNKTSNQLLSTTVNTLASLLSQQQQQQFNHNNILGTNGIGQGPVIPPETIISLLQSLISTSAVATATSSMNQSLSITKLNDQNQNDTFSTNDHIYSGIQEIDDPLIALKNIYNPNDFCVQHRKRIQQAQERFIQKIGVNSSSSGQASLIFSQLSELLPLNPTSVNATEDIINKMSSNVSSAISPRRSVGTKPCSSDSESDSSSPTRNNRSKFQISGNQDQSLSSSSIKNKFEIADQAREKRVETPDTTTSELVHETYETSSQENKKISSFSDQGLNLHQSEEYMNYPPKKRHKIISIERSNNNNNIKSTILMNSDETQSICEDDDVKLHQPLTTSTATKSSRFRNQNSSSSTEILQNNQIFTLSSNTRQISMSSSRSRNSSIEENAGGLHSINIDDAYRERRRKNNEAAKRSRDARRAKEDDIALRAAILERENLQLKVELAQLKQETNRLRCLLYNS